MLMLVGGIQTLRLRFWSRKPRHTAEKTLRDILTISRDTVYGREHHFDRIVLIIHGYGRAFPSLSTYGFIFAIMVVR